MVLEIVLLVMPKLLFSLAWSVVSQRKMTPNANSIYINDYVWIMPAIISPSGECLS